MERKKQPMPQPQNGDDGTNDLMVSDVLQVNEFQVWWMSEQLWGIWDRPKDQSTYSAVTALGD